MLTLRFVELSVIAYGVITLGRGLIIDLNEEPARYSGLSWFEKKFNLIGIGGLGISYGVFWLVATYLSKQMPDRAISHLILGSIGILVYLVIAELSSHYYDRYLIRNAAPAFGGSKVNDEDREKLSRTVIPWWVRASVIIVFLLLTRLFDIVAP
jgi:hypothetical protein